MKILMAFGFLSLLGLLTALAGLGLWKALVLAVETQGELAVRALFYATFFVASGVFTIVSCRQSRGQ